MKNQEIQVKYHLKHKKGLLIGGILFSFFFMGLLLIKFSISFHLNGDMITNISYKDFYQEQGVILKIFGKDFSQQVKIRGEVENGKIGEYPIVYSYSLAFFPMKITRTVKVTDLDAPIIELKGELKQTICPNAVYEEEGYTAYDEYDGDLTDKVEIIEEGNTIKYKVTDSFFNTTIKEREVRKEDKLSPTITLVGGSTIYVKKDSDYKEYGYQAMDGCDGDITDKVEVEGEVDTSKLQTYKVIYRVVDSSGNKQEVERTVIVNEVKTSSPTTPGVIYLTFDDGPSGTGSTAKILDVLKKQQVRATFFVTGSGPDSLIKRAHEEGHVVALHTYTHNYGQVYSSVDAFFADLERIGERVKNITGQETFVTRFPGGSNNTISSKYSKGLMPVLREQVITRGYSYFDWNVDASDAYQCAKASVTDKKLCVYKNVTGGLSKTRSNVVLMHDIKSYTADALNDIIEYAKNAGYTFDVLTTTTNPVRFR